MKKRKIVVTVASLTMATASALAVGINPTFAEVTESDTLSVLAENVASEFVLPVSVDEASWSYHGYGDWKVLNLKVNDTMYQLSKSGAVDVKFHIGDSIKVYAGNSYELWSGTIEANGDSFKISMESCSKKWKCNLDYVKSSNQLVFKKANTLSGGGVASVSKSKYYNYDVTAKSKNGTPLEGIRVVDQFDNNSLYSVYNDDIHYNGDENSKVFPYQKTWGNGNSADIAWNFSEEVGGNGVTGTVIFTTDSNGYTDMVIPDLCVNDNDVFYGGGAIGFSYGRDYDVYANNGLVDIRESHIKLDGNDKLVFTTLSRLGEEASISPKETDEILGDSYEAFKVSNFVSNSVTLQDTTGNDIAVVTMSLKDTSKLHITNDKDYTGIEPDVSVKMADGVSDWNVSVDFKDDRFHINAVKQESSSDNDSVDTPDVVLNGLNQSADGNWYYYVNGNIDTNYTGIAQNEYGWWKVTNGTVDFSANGLQFDAGTDIWWYFNNGGIDFTYTGLAENEYGWWKITDGNVDFTYNGLGLNEYGWWKVTNGEVDLNYNGLADNEYGWWKVANGTIDFSANGLQFDEGTNAWWYFNNGAIDFNYTGLAENEFGWWKITDGTVDFDFNGMAENEYGWWYLTNGTVDFGYNGVANNQYGWWKITNGAVDFTANGLIFDAEKNAWFYFNNGAIDFDYTGLAENENGWWKVINGTVDFTYNGKADNQYGTWNVVNGHVEV